MGLTSVFPSSMRTAAIATLSFLVLTGCIGYQKSNSAVHAQITREEANRKANKFKKQASFAKHQDNSPQTQEVRKKLARMRERRKHEMIEDYARLRREKEAKERPQRERPEKKKQRPNPYNFEAQDEKQFHEDMERNVEEQLAFEERLSEELKNTPDAMLEIPFMIFFALYFIVASILFTTCVCCYTETVEKHRRIKAGLDLPNKSMRGGSAVRVGRPDETMRRRANLSAA